MERRDGTHQNVKLGGGKKASPREIPLHKSAFTSEDAPKVPIHLPDNRQGVKVGKGEWPYTPGKVSHKVSGNKSKSSKNRSGY